MIKRIAAVAVMMVLGASAADAQRGGMHGQMSDSVPSMGMAQGMMMGGMMGSGMMQMMAQGMGTMATGGPGPTTLLRMRHALELTDTQVSRLEEIQREVQSTVQPQMTAMMSSHDAARQALQGDSPDFDAYQRSLQTAANIMVQMHVAMARGQVEARELLTPEQRERLETRGSEMMQGMMGGWGWGMMHR